MGPHPEERGRQPECLEGWPRACLWPSFDTRGRAAQDEAVLAKAVDGRADPAVLQSRHHVARAAAGAAGPATDDPALPDRDPARASRRASLRACVAFRFAHGALGHDRGDRFLPRRAAAGAADLRLFGPAVRRHPPSPLTAVAVAFFLNTSSYYGEIYRAGIESVGRGQWDAARSTGLSAFATLTHVVLPQAVRNVLPDLVSNTVEVVEAHLDRQRGGTAGAALFGRHGTLGHLQCLADRACGGDLSCHAMAGGPADQPA